jgi:hypothetical protein
MIMNTLRRLIPVLLLSIAGPTVLAAEPQTARFDHYNPVALNELALAKIAAGDTGTAAILLERAVLLAPYDARIRRNLELLRASQTGKSAAMPAQPAPVPSVSTPTEPDDSPVQPFQLWKQR